MYKVRTSKTNEAVPIWIARELTQRMHIVRKLKPPKGGETENREFNDI